MDLLEKKMKLSENEAYYENGIIQQLSPKQAWIVDGLRLHGIEILAALQRTVSYPTD